MTKYICLEGGEGSYKTTSANALVKKLQENGHKVLQTKEPGTSLLPVTMKLRELMLSNEFDSQLTRQSRELISQAIRSIHIEQLIMPAIKSGEYDYIVQDRGILSGKIYATACGNDSNEIRDLERFILSSYWEEYSNSRPFLYDHIFVMINDGGLEIAKNAKQEYAGGDAMENRGQEFHKKVNSDFAWWANTLRHANSITKNISTIGVKGKTTDQIVEMMLQQLVS